MTDSSEPPSTSSPRAPTSFIHPRREPFEHGLLPIPKLIFTDGTQSLGPIKDKLLSLSSAAPAHRVNADAIAETLQISPDHSRLIIETIASVLHSESDPLVNAKPSEIDSVGVSVFDLVIFLYIQSYKRLLPKGHRDSAAVADVWPSTSAFDGFLSALSPLQLVRSNSRRFMPSQSDEEAHQLSYLQKHLGNILSLLADSPEGDGEESMVRKSMLRCFKSHFISSASCVRPAVPWGMAYAAYLELCFTLDAEESHYMIMFTCLVLSMEKFEHLGFLIYFGEKYTERSPLSQNSPFFANSDPDMPAVPVAAAQVHDWLLQNILFSLERITDRISAKENGPSSASDQDVMMADACTSSAKTSSTPRGPSFIEGISKSSYVKQAADLKGSSVKVVNCHESVIYILSPLKYATVYGCSDATIVLGAVGKAVRVEHCERVHVIAAAKRICIANCRECIFFLGVNQRPLVIGDNHKLQVAPYNTFYAHLEEHMSHVDVHPTINKWDEPIALGMVDPHDSLSHPAGVSEVQPESATRMDPDQFTCFLIPNWFGGEEAGSTKDNPFPLPDGYLSSQHRNLKNLEEVKQLLRETALEDSRKREVASALHLRAISGNCTVYKAIDVG